MRINHVDILVVLNYVCMYMYVCMLSRFRNVIMYSMHVHTMAMHWLARIYSDTALFPDVRAKAQVLGYCTLQSTLLYELITLCVHLVYYQYHSSVDNYSISCEF